MMMMMANEMAIGILAYGSLIDNPGAELQAVISEIRKDVPTPFKVEYARASKTRDGGPTLVPLDTGGQVRAALLVLKPAVTILQATDMLYRREIGRVGSSKSYTPTTGPNGVHVKRLANALGVATVLYTSIPGNITPLTPKELARRAIESARGAAGADQQDGISYLRRAIEIGIETPMTPDYVKEILEITGTEGLQAAWASVRQSVRSN
jgi:cation transport regulator ChaC